MLPRAPLSPLLPALPPVRAIGIHTAHPVPHRGHSCVPASKSNTDGTSESTAHVSPVQWPGAVWVQLGAPPAALCRWYGHGL